MMKINRKHKYKGITQEVLLKVLIYLSMYISYLTFHSFYELSPPL